VSGGGLHVQASSSLVLQKCVFTHCSIRDAFSKFIPSGGGALGTLNVSNISISGSSFLNNLDSSGTGSLFLQQLQPAVPSKVTFDSSNVTVPPDGGLALNVSCGVDCSLQTQQLIFVSFSSTNMSLLDVSSSSSDSVLYALPAGAVVSSQGSFASCRPASTSAVAVFSYSNSRAKYLACGSCADPFHVALSSQDFAIESSQSALNMRCIRLTSNNASQSCPFGVTFCTTVSVITQGFWTNFKRKDAPPFYEVNSIVLCPLGYCGCGNKYCNLDPPFAPGYRPDSLLCTGNRAGVLCGACKPGFTQSLDGVTCLSNEECAKNVGWTWAVTVVGFSLFAVYTVVQSAKPGGGLITCMFFYGQMSSFSSMPQYVSSVSAGASDASHTWVTRVLQFLSIAHLYPQTCYGPNMGAYDLNAAELSGPAIVLVMSLAITLVLKAAQPLMRRRSIEVNFSISTTLVTVALFIFSSVTTDVAQLVTCQTDLDVVFIDGTVPCYDARWQGLIAVLFVLCTVPVLYAAALRWKLLPPDTRNIVCSAFLEAKYYWGAVTLAFRLVLSIISALLEESPSTSALVRSFVCLAMLMLLTNQKPYRLSTTYYFDVFCYFCLIVQFSFEVLVRASESLGLPLDADSRISRQLLNSHTAASFVRCVGCCAHRLCCLHLTVCIMQDRSVRGWYRIVDVFGTRKDCSKIIFRRSLPQALHDSKAPV
jgi:hypothetical protein